LPENNIPLIKISRQRIKTIDESLPPLPWEKWQELRKRQISEEKINLILKKHFLLKSINFIEKKRVFSKEEIEAWVIFFFNHLNISSEINLSVFQKRWKLYLKIFDFFQRRSFENQELKMMVERAFSVSSTRGFFNDFKKKKSGKEEALIFKKLNSIWNEDLKKKHSIRPQKVKNFLFGQIKTSFPNSNSKNFSSFIDKFIEMST
jgi:Asp-tRNA(Asn)/Glu-tRNA(Gln) amidotransferase B subunit